MPNRTCMPDFPFPSFGLFTSSSFARNESVARRNRPAGNSTRCVTSAGTFCDRSTATAMPRPAYPASGAQRNAVPYRTS